MRSASSENDKQNLVVTTACLQIHVADDDPFSLTRGGALEDLSRVEKYRMSEEDYDKRKGTLRSVRGTFFSRPRNQACVG